MADFSSLKQTIQGYIKQNGNEEITGNILQDVLLAMVTTMGDSAINSLASALQDEITARQNQDGTLQGNITAETTARQQADTALGGRIDGLQTAVNGINTKLAEGYIYAGIATPSTNPGTPSGKVFYIAVSSGTYTNFSNLTAAQGINILKYNGSAWSKDVVYAIDTRPKKNSQNLVTSGGVFDNMGALDVSELNATENPRTLAQYADLAAALAAIPTDYQKGGMSIKFVQTYDNKYVQYRLMTTSFSTTASDWQGVDDWVENSIGLKGYVYCVIGDVNQYGVYNPENTARSIIVGKGIEKVSLNGQAGLKYALYGNNSGLNNPVTPITEGWTTDDFVNTTDYEYLFVKVAHTDGRTIFTDAPKIYAEFTNYEGVVSVSDTSENSGRPISAETFSNYILNPPLTKMSGMVKCIIGSTNQYGVFNPSITDRATLILRGVKKISLNGQNDLKFAVYGNYNGLNYIIVPLTDGWITNDFINESDYDYFFVTVAHTDGTTEFDTLPSLYVEFSDYRGIESVVFQDETYKDKYLSTEAFGEVMGEVGQRLASVPTKNMKRMSLIIIYGQSLSIGADSVAISTTIDNYHNAMMFKQGVIERKAASDLEQLTYLREISVETPARGLSEAFVETAQQENMFSEYSTLWTEKQFLLACPGVGAATIDMLTDNSNYQYVENIITAAKTICDNYGYELDIPVWCWLQGENDIKTSMSASVYKSKLLALQDKFCASVLSITGITERPKCVVYQPNCQSLYKTGGTGVDNQFDFDYDHMGVQTAFMELVRDNSEFIASAPTYICDPCAENKGWWVHCDAKSYKLLGAMLGYNIKKYLVDGISNKGVIPTDIAVSGNTIKLKYNVPCPPLTFDTNYVREVPHMGFNVIKTDNSDIISSISLFNDTVTIECSESPVGCKLRYGMNGDFIITTTYRGISGREHGGRGNLRDCQGNYFYKDIEGIKYPLHNWAYTFEYLIS